MATENITGNESLEELQNLLEIMQKRLTILEEKKNLTRPEIYSKVRAEYVANIEKIQNLMVEKGADLEEALNQAIVDRDTLNVRKQELRDILDEMELRLAIGEMDEATKAQQSQEYIEEMDEIEGKLASFEEKIANLQRLIQASARPAKPAPIMAPTPKIEPKPAPQPRMPTIAQPSPQPQPTIPKQTPPKPVPVTPMAEPARPEPTRPAPVPPVPPRPQVSSIPRPEPKPTMTPPVPTAPQFPPEPQAPAGQPNEIDELEKQFASILGESLAQPGAAVEQPQVPKQEMDQAEVEESHEGEIKCPKCGSFNRADNWYCEKCGNELISAQDLMGK